MTDKIHDFAMKMLLRKFIVYNNDLTYPNNFAEICVFGQCVILVVIIGEQEYVQSKPNQLNYEG
jgi:hypothetical protein